MRNRHKFTFIFSCIAADVLAVIAGVWVYLQFAMSASHGLGQFSLYYLIVVAMLSWLLPSLYFNLYRLDSIFVLESFYRNSWRCFLTHLFLWQCCLYAVQGRDQYHVITNATIFLWSLLLVYFLVSRAAFALLLLKTKKWAKQPFNVAIWGFNTTSIELAAQLEVNNYFINFLGIINDTTDHEYTNHDEFNQAIIQAIHSASEANIQELYVVTKPNFIVDLNAIFELADRYCIRLKFIPDFSGLSKHSYKAANFNNFHIITPRHEPLQNAYNRLVKRVFDIVFSVCVILFLLSWLYPIIAVIIKIQSRGPVLFKQLRTGKKNQSFWCYKFRSMTVNSQSDSLQAQKEDARVTPIGKFIRRTSIDELPQFFNVLLGDMSVVGPRPHMLKHTQDYNEQINNFMVRHFVKPGITGLAQVSGFRGETKKVSDMKRRVNADIDYVQNWSFIKDIKICILTIIVTLKGDENAF
jgi:putative colanic acid biosynthesis UDP-glucose lipid carrier transferase